MADHAKPTLSSTYTAFLSELDGRIKDAALAFDPATSSPSNVPTHAVRWSSASNKWQKWNGTAWADLATTYAISISGNAATVTNGVYTSRTITAGNGLTGGGDLSTSRTLTLGTPGTLTTSTTNAVTTTSHTHSVTFPVTSVAGKTGAVTLAKADVGLGSVDNTSDASKPVSTATQTALDLKANSATAIEQADIGTAPNQVPLNQHLGGMAFQHPESVVIRPAASVTPQQVGAMVFQLASDTSLVVKVKGSDGTVRSATLTLA